MSVQSEQTDLSQLHQNLHQSLRQLLHTGTECPLGTLALFQAAKRDLAGTDRQINDKVLLDALEDLNATHPDDAKLLHLRFVKGESAQAVANKLAIAVPTLGTNQRNAIGKLAQLVYEKEHQARERFSNEINMRLALPSYDQLFGIEEHLEHLITLLAVPEKPWIVLIEGIGGVGKTSFADMAIREAIRRMFFANIGWISAKRHRLSLDGNLKEIKPTITKEMLVKELAEQFLDSDSLPKPFSVENVLPILHARLKQEPYLIGIDNLETVEDVEALLPTLHYLAGPTKFLLTSRKSIQSEIPVYPFSLPPLDAENALNLIRHEAEMRNLPELRTCSDQELMPIFDVVGGNPLALRLVVGQTHLLSLDVILNNLKTMSGQTMENLYTYIFRHAWDNMDEMTRSVFIAMPYIPEQGKPLDYLAEACELDINVLSNPISKLVTLNLVNKHGLTNSRYSIHSLTRTFLHEQIVKWS